MPKYTDPLSVERVTPTSLAGSVPTFVTAKRTTSLSPGDSDCSESAASRSRGTESTAILAFSVSVLVRSVTVWFGWTEAV